MSAPFSKLNVKMRVFVEPVTGVEEKEDVRDDETQLVGRSQIQKPCAL